VEVRRVLAGQAALLRALRLRALREDADAFGSTLAREASLPVEHWQHWAAESDVGERSVVFVASVPDWVGMAVGFLDTDRPGVASLGGMWVDSAFRRRGLGGELLQAIIDWATACGAETIELSVMESNVAAERLYLGAGFVATGVREPLGRERALSKSFMTRAL
jgi:ribosomal protein S18 acetylase RimI-like enzyme